jgi:murein DD-endopeptidase MepM/ murein hydrolase activator NlpD
VNRRSVLRMGMILAAGAVVLGYSLRRQTNASAEYRQQVELAREEAEHIRQSMVLPTVQGMPAGENFSGALRKLGLSTEQAADATAAAQQTFNLRHLRAGNTLTVNRSVDGALRDINYKIDAQRVLHLVPQPQGFSAEVKEIPIHAAVTVVSGRLEDSLFHALEKAGESAELAMRLAQIFGYDLDFYTDPRRGDTFHILPEKKTYRTGEPAGYGNILAAEYINGGEKYQALLFRDEKGQSGYYRADGKSLQKAFLRSPLKFSAPVTSHFSKSRYHPILKTYRAHLGTDYGAPTGMPVQTIASGRVLFSGRKGGDGNVVHIAHANGYETYYLHLSKMFVHAGEHVEAGKRIGLVGGTGLATGPHLDFRIAQKGQFKNFETLGLPPSEPVAKKYWTEFAALREQWLPMLEREAQPVLETAQAHAGETEKH